MADASRTKSRPATGKLPSTTGVPLPRGKENVRPSAAASNKKVSFTKESICRRHVDQASSQVDHAFPNSLAVKKVPFQVHCDERNVPSERKPREESRLRIQSTNGPGLRVIDDVLNEATRERSIIGRGTIEKSRFDKKPLPSKIPRRSRSCSVSTDRNLSKRSTEIEKKVSRLIKEKERGRAACTMVSSIPVESAIQEDGRTANKTYNIDAVEIPRCPKKRDSLPVELLYHTEYHEDLPNVEHQREKRSIRLSANFLQRRVNVEQRRLVVIFMIHVGKHCRYPSFIVYQAVKLFDVVLDKIPLDTEFLQLGALASLWIALKKQENYHKIPTASAMVALAKELYISREDLLIAYEREILMSLNFNVTFADPFSLFNHHLINSKRCAGVPEEIALFLYHCGGYLIDVTLLDEQFCRISASLIAVTAAELALGLTFDAVVENARPRWLFWRGQLFANDPSLSERFQDKEIDQCRITMLRRVLNSGLKRNGFEVVYKKYSSSRYGRIAERLIERAAKLSLSESLFDP
nr:uncharacterized protein LOC117603872 [Osmia lignaria]